MELNFKFNSIFLLFIKNLFGNFALPDLVLVFLILYNQKNYERRKTTRRIFFRGDIDRA